MDLEQLTKGQIILLTLLVSFVTSIATGIVTVSLMQQVPPPVTQTINRVVERTLERVVEQKTDAQGNTVTKEKTVVVKETDLISKAVQTAMPSLVAVYAVEPAGEANDGNVSAASNMQQAAVASTGSDTQTEKKESRRFLARGVFTSDAVIQTDGGVIPEKATLEIVVLTTGAVYPVKAVEIKDGVAFLSVAAKTGTSMRRGEVQALQLGNTLVALGGENKVQVATVIVSDLDRNTSKSVIGMTVDGVTPAPGTLLVDLEGQLIAQFVRGAWKL